jgi:hypothetical protein
VEEEKFKLSVAENQLTVDMPEDTFYVEGIQIAKRGIAMDIQKYTNVYEIKFIETYKSEPKPEAAPAVVKEEKKEEAPAAEATAAEPKAETAKPKAKAKKAKAVEE